MLKIYNLKTGIGVKCQVRDQRSSYGNKQKVVLKHNLRMEINSKAFVIPLLTRSGLILADVIAVRIGMDSKCFRIYFHSLAPFLTCFYTSLISNLFVYFSTFYPDSIFKIVNF